MLARAAISFLERPFRNANFMCGIFGIAFHHDRNELGRVLTRAGHALSYRGYDSVGAAAVNSRGDVDLRKDVGKMGDVAERLGFEELSGRRGILQLRWATFGIPAKRNAQPHLDTANKIVGAHNGNIVNSVALRRQLSEEGHVFLGENDGEVVVQAVSYQLARTGSLDKAVRAAREMLKGDYAYVVAERLNSPLFAAKMGSSLYLGIGDDFVCISSDLPSILNLTHKIIPLLDGEYVEFDYNSYEIRSIETGERIERAPMVTELTPEAASKGEHAFFMGKEIDEQPERAQALLNFLNESGEVAPFAECIANAERVYLIGSGSSYNACVLGSYFFNKFTGCVTHPVIAGSFLQHYGECLRPGDLFVLVSQSGETKDAINVLNALSGRGLGERVLGIVNVPGSTLMMRSKRTLPLLSNLEIAVAATKTFVNQVLLLMGVAAHIARDRERAPEFVASIARVPAALRAVIDGLQPKAEELAARLLHSQDMYALGHGITVGAAYEGALKIKEITYSHCEGMDSIEFKHGPLAIVTEGYPVFFLSTLEDQSMMISHINEVTCRGGLAIVVAPESKALRENARVLYALPCSDYGLVPLEGAVFMQLFAYHLAALRGQSPDYPRNCSKTITVD